VKHLVKQSLFGPLAICLALGACAGPTPDGAGPAAEGAAEGDSVVMEPSGAIAQAPPPAVSRRMLAPAERAAFAARRRRAEAAPGAPGPGTTRPAPKSVRKPVTPVTGPRGAEERDREITARSLERLASLPPDARVTLLVELADPGYDFGQLRGKEDTERLGLISARLGQIARPQEEVASALEANSAAIVGRFWLGGSGLAVETSAASAPAIAALPGVRFVELDVAEDQPTGAYDLTDIRNGTGIQSLIDAGFASDTNNRTDPARPIRIGIIETDGNGLGDNYIGRAHVGFCDDAGGCTSRVRRVYQCTSSCRTTTAAMDPGTPHGQIVSSIAAGDITQGQDPGYPGGNSADQRRRSGMAPEADIHYYLYDGAAGLRNAVQQVVEDGVDVVNMSFGWGTCDPDEDHGAVNAAIRAATDADVFFVGATGTDSRSLDEPCRVMWPATRPEVLAVVGLMSSDSTIPYGDLSIGYPEGPDPGCASRFGDIPIVMRDGSEHTATVLGLAAPGVVRRVLRDPPDRYDETDSGGCGSSFAAPVVAGAASDLRDLFREMGWAAADDARALYVNMALMGDAWDGQDVTTPGGSIRLGDRPSRHSGYGRLVMQWPEAGGATGPWYWHWAPYTVHTGEEISVPVSTGGAEPDGITELKAVAAWFPTRLDSVSDVVLQVVSDCDGQAMDEVLEADDSFDYHKRVRLPGAAAAGRCLVSRLVGVDTPPAGQTVYLAHMYHAGPP
jgi:hypothetical protein